ncbi:6-bladed beta-propeller [Roseivirga pacifica]|uniref:6-bladed beta-propeller n=1 Tax=Roseivirga pacifica TaxID=1267423 RepID=UPI00209651CB|nr:6-bladed beta-propeller [Roseivirga pacifica]MCO6358991.1 6-bladed beta-propeller [Roseivirga pacifica]MCO6365373.1 6-bladed beta-propeller [Roseivirga pacifica]MCO6371897.1 6-bladed beta-propeller [Roseivirga pacifica]MCO6375992.1 6-bladed beta-propeller [Roseivirga pacifica]MCO6379275.1 6-bladed beta-propeller [Roseivirga pacifica]
MTRTFNKLLLPLMACTILGCSSKRDEANHTDFLDKHITYKINPDDKHSSLFELAEVFTFTTLEERDSSLITSPFMLEVLEDYYIVLDPGRKDIFIFDTKGDFIRKINRFGQGPEEYALIKNMWVEGEQIAIFDSRNGRIQHYDLDGNHIESNRMKYLNATNIYFKDGFYFIDMNGAATEDNSKYNVLVLDETFDLVERLNPFETSPPISLGWGFNSFRENNGLLYYNQPSSDTVFSITSKESKASFTLDFGDLWLWDNESATKDYASIIEIINSSNLIPTFKTYVNNELVYFEFLSSQKLKKAILDRSSGEYKVLNVDKSDGNNYSLNVVDWYDSRLLFTIESDELEEFIGDVESNGGEINHRPNKISENPVLVWVTLKGSNQW